MSDALESARELIAAARERYRQDEAALAELDELNARLQQPLRVALVGSVKAGKSTLLNGLLGERLAPTDSRESTRVVTWYHYGKTPTVRARLTDGRTVSIPAKRQPDRHELDLQGLAPEDCDRLDVTWPAPGIQGITLIDTPGISSISQEISDETNRFLLPQQGAAGADAVVYLLRALHESDIRYLQALDARTRHGSASIGSIGVLSRADELGSGRLTAMLSINQAVERLRNHPDLQGVCETIVPLAGLMGMGAMTLRQSDFAVLRDLASLTPADTDRLMVSAELFITAKGDALPAERTRVELVDRFGMYGIRIAIAVIRGGINDASDLAAEMLRRSGLDELRRVIDVHFRQRQDELKAHSIVHALHRLLRQKPVPGAEELLVMADEHMSQTHTFIEMQLLGHIAGGQIQLGSALVAELERLVGGHGASVQTRLGFDADFLDQEIILASAVEHLTRWRGLLENPLLDRVTRQACRVAVRSCENIIVSLKTGKVSLAPVKSPA
ncbi:MAG: dynamin family protein [Gulosibacter sp.]|uniref:dynamin family protein n=1 Tax=Gulosibacter sp. TaxID=2817531 RepID=UPI003F8DDD60